MLLRKSRAGFGDGRDNPPNTTLSIEPLFVEIVERA
jgi:hypothetical protein